MTDPDALAEAGFPAKILRTFHGPFRDDGIDYCGWDGHEGCGETWPCSSVRDRPGVTVTRVVSTRAGWAAAEFADGSSSEWPIGGADLAGSHRQARHNALALESIILATDAPQCEHACAVGVDDTPLRHPGKTWKCSECDKTFSA